MFSKILIANRGEIAVRIARSARNMGIQTVAVYSEADKDALHVSAADEAYHIGGATPLESYLNGGRIIDVALQSGAQAIHPGYGFLSENPDFAESLEKAGLTFIGPSAGAMRSMGLKDAAKALMEKANVPVVPGYHGASQDFDLLRSQAEAIGYPLLIKAVAGGGGKGMRLVERAQDFEAALRSARSEAQNAFGNPDVLLEKYISAPRHIEIQVFGDGQKAVHLFERDCSLQRRYQKVIEEAPAPGMTSTLRSAMGAAAVRAAEAIGYKGAGTVEFIVDGSKGLRDDGFWFMEMNTRLQVEHPVTEAITGIDLVEWQLRVAAGEPLPLAQEDIRFDGHAIEARIYAEDASKGFLPVTGRLDHVRFCDQSRNDSAVRAGDVISPFYDPMIAKVIVHGRDRKEALARLSNSLRQTELAGSKTNLEFLISLAEHPDFHAMTVDTKWIDRKVDELTKTAEPSASVLLAAALAVVGDQAAKSAFSGFNLWSSLSQTITLIHADITFTLALNFGPNSLTIEHEGQSFAAHFKDQRWWYSTQRLPHSVCMKNTVWVFEKGGVVFETIDLLDRSGSDFADMNVIRAPMPGLVNFVGVAKGDILEKGDRILGLEAMKMEHVLTAPQNCVVDEVLVRVKDQVEAAAVLVRLSGLQESG